MKLAIRGPLISAIYINLVAFIVTVEVVMNIISFNVKFQSDSTKDGGVIAGGIYTTFLPVKYSRVVFVSFILQCALSTLHGRDSLPWVLILIDNQSCVKSLLCFLLIACGYSVIIYRTCPFGVFSYSKQNLGALTAVTFWNTTNLQFVLPDCWTNAVSIQKFLKTNAKLHDRTKSVSYMFISITCTQTMRHGSVTFTNWCGTMLMIDGQLQHSWSTEDDEVIMVILTLHTHHLISTN